VSVAFYKGPLRNVEDAAAAGLIVIITCQRCSRSHETWAYNLCREFP
jgi:hypothetical protein